MKWYFISLTAYMAELQLMSWGRVTFYDEQARFESWSYAGFFTLWRNVVVPYTHENTLPLAAMGGACSCYGG
ncbi:MAG: hypothetical protein LC641_07340, partial [Spirochaeta sp.]|nr:hypothetical protein [Spirochaeta sp.]